MRLSLRWKTISIVGIAGALPLLTGLVSILILGHRHLTAEKGILYQTVAEDTADGLARLVKEQIERLQLWISYSQLPAAVASLPGSGPGTKGDGVPADAMALDRRWPELGNDAPEIAKVLGNKDAKELLRFQSLSPLFSEIFVTDSEGRLMAATNKTTDYWQADEDWWREAARSLNHEVRVEGINFDESAGVHSVDLATPLYGGPDGERLIGVLKAVLNISPLLASINPLLNGHGAHSSLIVGNGRILAGLSGQHDDLGDEAVPDRVAQRLTHVRSGWMEEVLLRGRPDLIGFARFDLASGAAPGTRVVGMDSVYVLVYEDISGVLVPIRRQLWIFVAVSGVAVGVFMLLGLFFAEKAIVFPLDLLHSAARVISARVGPRDPEGPGKRAAAMPAESAVRYISRQVGKIRTEDEIGQLARAFELMSRRVLNYHEQLEKEIESRTREVEKDLRLARDFQEALLPREYPEVPGPGVETRVRLEFSHVYRPALSVSGDFFDISERSGWEAAVLIADVMGHGVQSALTMAILRTLLRDIRRNTGDPAEALSLVNRQFHEIIPRKGRVVFATTLCLYFDVRNETATCASAGHMSPILARRDAKTVAPLLGEGEIGPAIGLLPSADYAVHSHSLEPGDMVFLFTDGITEAQNSSGEQFGMDRLTALIRNNLHQNAAGIGKSISLAINDYMDTVVQKDDICLVIVEAVADREWNGSEVPESGAGRIGEDTRPDTLSRPR